MRTSLTDWGVVMSGHPVCSLWCGHHLTWHINCLEMLAVFWALNNFLPDLRDCHVLVRTDNKAVVFYVNHQGGLRSHPLYKLAHQILVWSQGKLLSLRSIHIPGHLNMGADILSRQRPRPREMDASPPRVDMVEFLARLRLICLRLIRHHTVPSGSLCLIQLRWGWILWYRLGRGFVCMPFPRSLCSREF